MGQGHVGRAIKNAIASGRVAHAYLFTGARGVGKTSTARIFAKALNCPNAEDGVPCNACEVCESIGTGSDVDVLEIDGASNRGIDDIRQLRANVNIRSMRSASKVYIIDEVHMLTKEAFNALLKTLEEPPPNVKFVFCTTEPQKVPDTILSRCQRFDFGTITSAKIEDRLAEIAAAEGVSVDAEAVAMVARRAAGSMRDSQSLFDQLLAFGGQQIGADDVHRLFGTAADDRIVALMNHVINGDRAAALSDLDAALDAGVRLDALTDQLVAYLRDLMVLAAGAADLTLASVSDASRKTLAGQAEAWGLRTASAAMQILSDTKLKMSRTVHGRPLLELALIRLTLLEDLDGLAELVRNARGGGLSLPQAGDRAKKKRLAEPAPTPRPLTSPTPAEAPPIPADVPADTPHPSSVSPRPNLSDNRSQPTDSGQPDPDRQPVAIPLDSDAFWPELLASVPEGLKTQLKSVTRHAVDGDRLTLWVKGPFNVNALKRPAAQSRLRTVTAEIAGVEATFTMQLDQEAAAAAAGAANQERVRESRLRKTSTVEDDPYVTAALEVFGGTIVEVKTIPKVLSRPDTDETLDPDYTSNEPFEEDD